MRSQLNAIFWGVRCPFGRNVRYGGIMGTIRYLRHVTREPGSVTLFITLRSFVRLRIFSTELLWARSTLSGWFKLRRMHCDNVKANKRRVSYIRLIASYFRLPDYFWPFKRMTNAHYLECFALILTTISDHQNLSKTKPRFEDIWMIDTIKFYIREKLRV